MLLLAMEGFKTKNKVFYMVGDTLNDINAAKAANIKSIVVDDRLLLNKSSVNMFSIPVKDQ